MKSRREFLKFIGMAAASVAISPLLAKSYMKPNIVYILADDMGPGDVHAYNKECKFPTPNIDRLAKEGMKFMNAHTNSSVCTPTRYGILTGRYAWRTKKKSGVLQGHSPYLISTDRETVASFLKKEGYNTACIGKWHLGMDWATTDGSKITKGSKEPKIDFCVPIQNGPLDVGFDYYFGISASLNMDPHAFIDGRKVIGNMVYAENKEDIKALGLVKAKPGWASKEFKQDQVLPTFTDKTVNWIREHHKKSSDKPFFVYMPLNSPHSPIVPSEKFKGKSGLNDHADFCMETDWSVGEVLKMLDELKISDNTIVIFTSDNGTSPTSNFKLLQSKGHFSSWKYRGLKGTLWEGGHRMPFLVRWPDRVQKASIDDQNICTTDLIATCAELYERKLPDNVGEDSISFLPALYGKKISANEERGIVHHSDSGIFSITQGNWKLVLDEKGGSRRTNPKDKPIVDSSEILLFDMEKDVSETTNLTQKFPEKVEELKKLLADYVNMGRSTPGEKQRNEFSNKRKWSQLEPITEYLDDRIKEKLGI